eukprot:2116425-Rhodomonas_salina.1
MSTSCFSASKSIFKSCPTSFGCTLQWREMCFHTKQPVKFLIANFLLAFAAAAPDVTFFSRHR